MTTVSVVIPTVGRESLQRAVASASVQGTYVREIIIVNTAAESLSDLKAVDSRVRVIDVGKASPARARNAGIAAATGDWVALLDDDDEWHLGYVDAQLTYARKKNLDVVISASVVRRGTRQFKRPARVIHTEPTVLHAFYGKPRWRGSKYSVPTSCVVVKREWARKYPMNEELSVREDIWWLYDLQSSGACVEQHLNPLCTIHASPSRAVNRESRATVAQWAHLLANVDPRLVRGFAWGIGLRTAVLARSWDTAVEALQLGFKKGR